MRWLALLFGILPLTAQDGRLSACFNNGICVRISTRLVPGNTTVRPGSVTSGRNDTWIRVIKDATGKPVVGYALQAERKGSGLLLRLLPATGTRRTVARREISDIKEGDTVSVDLLSNPRKGEILMDLLQVTLEPPSEAPAGVEEFVLDRVFVAVRGSFGELHWPSHARITGAAALIYLPERGGFLLSLAQQPGFEPAGIADKNRITFVWNDELVEIESQSANILRNAPFARVWVRHAREYKPSLDPTRLSIMTADKIDYLMPK
jgi:hypothetical protein